MIARRFCATTAREPLEGPGGVGPAVMQQAQLLADDVAAQRLRGEQPGDPAHLAGASRR